MGCDTAADYSGTTIYKAEGKIATLVTGNGEIVLLGVSGNSAILPTLIRNLKIDDTPADRDPAAADAWASTVAEAVTGVLADAHPPLITTADSDNPSSMDGTALLAWQHHLWIVHTHGAIRPYSRLAAIGSGTDVAIGSLHASRYAGTGPTKAVDLAVRHACTYAAGCRIDERGPLLYTTRGSHG